uniref:Uncharacterized protein n=1 Tax=Lactuca sativa TaxID=4236 RepID=A0A9R1WSH5_LACSA|nr:hypothetical protein LSAT_V11C900465410 [Lactuca sativa]
MLIFDWGSYLWVFTYDDLEDTWNKIDRYFSLHERRQTFKYSISGFTASFRILQAVRACEFALRKNRDTPRMKRWSGTKKLKWVDVNNIFEMIKEGRRPSNNMSPSDDETTSSYYMLFQEYAYGERNPVPSLIREHFRRQDTSSSSMSSSGRSHGRGGPSGKPSLEEMSKRLHALEQQVFMNRKPTEAFVEKVDNENIWNNISFEEHAIFQTNFGETVVADESMNKNKTNENVFGDIEDEKELDERIDKAGHSTNKFDDDLHTTQKQKRRPKKKVDAKSTTPVPPPAFVVHDFSVLRSEVVLQNYFFHACKLEHRFYNLDLNIEFWSALFGHTRSRWLDEAELYFIFFILIAFYLLINNKSIITFAACDD